MMRTLLCYLLCVAALVTSAADKNPKDSLTAVLKKATGHQRVDVLNKLIKIIYKDETPKAKEYLAEAEKLSANYPQGKVGVLINKGRLVFLETKDPNKALEYYAEGLKQAESLNYSDGLEVLYGAVGNTYRDQGKMAEAKAIFESGLKKAEELKSIKLKAKLLNNLGVMEYYKGNLSGAMEYFKSSITEYEKTDLKGEAAGITMNLGIMLYRMGKNEESLVYYEKALKVLKEIKDTLSMANAFTNIAITKSNLGKHEEAIKIYFEAEKMYKSQKDMKGLAGCYDNLAASYKELAKRDLALKYVMEGLKIKEKEGDERGLIYSYLNMADLTQTLHDTTRALGYYNKACDLAKKLNDNYKYGHTLRAIAVVRSDQGKYAESEKLLNEALDISIKLNDIPGASTCYLTLGNLYKKQNDLDKSLKYYLEALKMKEQMGEKVSIAGLLNNIGVIYYDRKQYRESIKYYERALKIRAEIKNTQGVADSYLSLANSYKEISDFKNAYHYQVKFHAAWDSTFNSNITSQIAEMNAKYESAKKDQEILKRTAGEKEAKALAEKEALESKNANQRVMYLGVGFVLVLVLAGFTYRANLQRKKANAMLEKTNEKLAESNDEVMAQKFEIINQKHLVEEKQKEILDSIAYAKRLQEAILPPVSLIKKYLPESFVMYNPKDIVAGDFYWMHIVENSELNVGRKAKGSELILIAAADCTGHGVPGAMVSVVCSNALNRAVKEFGITEPGKILDKVRELVVETFGKSENEVKDGMDISLCAISGTHIKWSGANNPLWYLQDGEMKKIAPNKQPIGKTDNPEPFTTHSVQLKKSDILYLFTDGFADQFGGPAGKKYKSKQMEELFTATISDKMEVQEEKIQSAFQNWKGRLEQIDDVCIIGIRV